MDTDVTEVQCSAFIELGLTPGTTGNEVTVPG